jgi:hypothetical protein
LEVFHYRQALLQMQQGLSDRAVAKSGLIGRDKAAQLRQQASQAGWLEPGASLPDDATLAERFDAPKRAAAGPSSSLELHRERITSWIEDGINGRVIHRVLHDSHGYRGSYSSVYRMMCRIKAATPRVGF